ncbi:hypothetical protein ARSEF1564_008661 [Beauveria bassiana]
MQSLLPFKFGVEFELQLRPKIDVNSTISAPPISATVREQRKYNLALLQYIATILKKGNIDAKAPDLSEDENLDYTKWHVVLDASLSKLHIKDGFYPVEIITPVITADNEWAGKIDAFWQLLLGHFEEPATARCCPPSRQDKATLFCASNLQAPRLQKYFHQLGPIRALPVIFDKIDSASRDDVVDLVSPDKNRAWNLRPAKDGKAGSIEFRRPPAVATAKKAKHWIAFTIAFIYMSIRANPSYFSSKVELMQDYEEISHPNFLADLEDCAREAGVNSQLDPRLLQVDNVATLHFSMITLHNWMDGEDNLYRVRQDYEYSCTVQMDGGAETKYTYNKFHLLVRHQRRQDTKQVTQSIAYYMYATSTFENQPAQYQLPKSVETIYEDTATKASRTETTHHVFDKWGNPTEDIQSNGVRTGRKFYPSVGATGCPADPHGFQRYIKCETVTPAPSSYQTPIRSKQYIYSQHRTASTPYTSYFVAVDKVQALQDGKEFSTWEYSYVDQPDSRDHGRRQQQIIKVSEKCPMTTTWKYDYPDSDSMRRAVTTKSYDGYTAEAITHLSTLSGLAYTHKSIAGVQTDFEYDKIGQLTKKVVSPNTSYEASEEHRYSVLRGDIGYCVMTKDAKGVADQRR